MKILGFGDNIIDRFVDRGLAYPGGNCVNVAVFAQRLGADAAYLGVFGSDSYGELIRAALAAEGVEYDGSVVRDGPSGVSAFTVIDGERVFGEWNGGGVTMTQPMVIDEDLIDYVSGFDLVHSSVYSVAENELPKLRSGKVLVTYDFSSEDHYRTTEYFELVCPYVDLALISGSSLSDDEVRALLRRIVNSGAGMALATRGTRGATVYDGSVFVEAPAEIIADPSRIVDTMGCGDAFLTAFAMSLFGSGWRRSVAPNPAALRAALLEGAAFAAQRCLSDGAFGRAKSESDADAEYGASAPSTARLDTM